MSWADQVVGGSGSTDQSDQKCRYQWTKRVGLWLILLLLVFVGSGCGGELATPTRTPVPTWTPTPAGGIVNPPAPDQATPVAEATQAPAPAAPTDTPTAEPSTPAAPTDTPLPTATPAPVATDTPSAPTPTPTSEFQFRLEAAEKFPTDSLTVNVVRIYLYVYSSAEFGLGGYSLRVLHNGVQLTVEEVSTAGLPEPTRLEPSPYTRFTNLSLIFVEPQAGRWELQLLDGAGNAVGPVAPFDLTADEVTRELYVRYIRL